MVDYELFYEWAVDRLGAENIKILNTSHGTEICANSFYALKLLGKDDQKHHLWMNPSGGKSKHPEMGSFRCWLTDTSGSLVKLVADYDHISLEEAEETICGAISLRQLEQKVNAFFGIDQPIIQEPLVIKPKKSDFLELPPETYLIDNMSPTHYARKKAKAYLNSRKLPSDGLYVCIEGDYKDRIIIPYYNWDDELIFYNGRTITGNKLRYLKCSEVSQEEVIFMTSWPLANEKVFLMEGEFDAKTLDLIGYNGCALCGKDISEYQLELLKRYEIVLAFDSDDAGLHALTTIGNKFIEKGFNKLTYVRPPKFYKDWNNFYVNKSEETVREYIEKYEKPFTSATSDILFMKTL